MTYLTLIMRMSVRRICIASFSLSMLVFLFIHLTLDETDHPPEIILGQVPLQNPHGVVQIILENAAKKASEQQSQVAASDSGSDHVKGHFRERLVHLDLKGAPPNIDYYRQVFPLFRKLGATGLLIEYEDTYPYFGHLRELARKDAYNNSQIGEINNLASQSGLRVIPLVQTFGHMEFVLKHEKFRHLREDPKSEKGIHPLKAESSSLTNEMVDQIMILHPNITHIHIGCDEVYTLGKSKKSKDIMKKEGIMASDIYLRYVSALAKDIKRRHPGVTPIIWDDMLRKISKKDLLKYEVGQHLEPMVWKYTPNLQQYLRPSMWKKYRNVFPRIWVASAFKGATGQAQFITPIYHHLYNHISWNKMVKYESKDASDWIQGIALTGWTRYDHRRPICELLPVGIPSLAVCLQVLTNHFFNESDLDDVNANLKCDKPIIIINPDSINDIPLCSFPGSEIYTGVNVKYVLENSKNDFNETKSSRLYLKRWMETSLNKIFLSSDVNEWIEHNLKE